MTFNFWDCIAVLIARGLAQKKAQKIYSLCHCDRFLSDSACAQPSLKQRVPKLSLSHGSLPEACRPGGGKTLLGLGQRLRLADCFLQGTFFLQVSNIILIIGVVCPPLHFTLQKISFFGHTNAQKSATHGKFIFSLRTLL